MIKRNKWKLLFSSLVIFIPVVIGLILWNQLPDSVPIHFNINGNADGWSNKWFAVFVLPSIIIVTHWILILITCLDPKRQNIDEKPMGIILWVMPLISFLTSSITYMSALSIAINITFVLCAFFGVLFILLGNYLPKVKQNHTIGIRISWTLNDEENWNHTHRFAGKLFVVGGIILTATSFLANFLILITIFVVLIIASMVYSYVYYKKHNKF